MLRTRVVIASVIFLFILLSCAYAVEDKKMVVITINTATVEDILNNKYIRKIAEDGIVGIMNTRSNGRNNQYKPYVTLGSGQKADVYFDCLESYKVDKYIGEQYYNITFNRYSLGNLVNLSINRLNKINSLTLYDAQPGKLGEHLKSQGVSRCFIGGFWYDNSIKSPGFYISMDNYGLVDFGDVDEVFENGRLSLGKVVDSFRKYKDVSDFTVIELGEMESLYANKKLYSETTYELNKQRILDESGKAIELIVNSIDFSNTVLCIMAPYSSDVYNNDIELLSPVIIYDGGKSRGILSSYTTRNPGIISALDFAPYVLDYYGISTYGFIGYPIRYEYMKNHLDYILNLNTNVVSTSKSRPYVLKAFAIFIILILAIFTGKLLTGWSLSLSKITFIFKLCLLIPIAFLLEGSFVITNIFSRSLFIISTAFILTILVEKLFVEEINKIITIVFVNISALIIDILTGQSMLKMSIFSYDPVIGARYYGLGNEFLGVIIGCALIFCGCILEKKDGLKYIVSFILLFIALIIGLPVMGCNIGGFITASLGFSLFMLLEYNYCLRRAIKTSLLFFSLSVVIFLLINRMFSGTESHFSRMLEQIRVDGIGYFINIVFRKLSMALRLIRYTIWSKVLIVLIIAAVIITISPYNYVMSILKKNIHFKSAWIGAVIASFAAILFNDSGIVTAAIIMLYTVFSMIILLQSID